MSELTNLLRDQLNEQKAHMVNTPSDISVASHFAFLRLYGVIEGMLTQIEEQDRKIESAWKTIEYRGMP